MTNTLRTLVFSAAIALFVPVYAIADGSPPFPHLIVKGVAATDVRPDKATLTLQVSAFDPNSAVATETVQKQLVAVLGTLARYSVPDDGITSYNLTKVVERERVDRVERQIVGYYVSRKMKVELLDISTFADLVADIAKLENISTLDAKFDIKDRDTYESRLMNEAGADARRSAENMLQGMSRSLGPVHAIGESSWRSSIGHFSLAADANYPVAMAKYDASGYAKSVFVPSTIELRQTLHVIFEIE